MSKDELLIYQGNDGFIPIRNTIPPDLLAPRTVGTKRFFRITSPRESSRSHRYATIHSDRPAKK